MISIDQLLAKNLLPDPAIRLGIRNLLAKKLREEDRGGLENDQYQLLAFIDELDKSPIAVKTAGYVPDQVMAKPGEQLKLVFTRVEPTECGAQVKVDNGPVHDLPMNKPVEIAVTVPASGKVQFACGMDMMTGVVIVGS